MARHRTHSIEFKRQVVQEFLAGESPHALAKRHSISRNLIKIWVAKCEAGGLDSDTAAADLLADYEARIAALERLVGKLAMLSVRSSLSAQYSWRGSERSALRDRCRSLQ